MPLTTRQKVAIGVTVAGVLAAVTTVAIASASSAPKPAPPPLPPNVVRKQPPPAPEKPPPGPHPKIKLTPQPSPKPSPLPQTIDVIPGGTYHTAPAPNGTVLTVAAPGGASTMTATQTATGLRSGIVQGRFYYAVLDGGAGKVVLQWVDQNDNAQTATVLVVGA